MDTEQVLNQTLELLQQDIGRLQAQWRIAQVQALGLQQELRQALARIQELEVESGKESALDAD